MWTVLIHPLEDSSFQITDWNLVHTAKLSSRGRGERQDMASIWRKRLRNSMAYGERGAVAGAQWSGGQGVEAPWRWKHFSFDEVQMSRIFIHCFLIRWTQIWLFKRILLRFWRLNTEWLNYFVFETTQLLKLVSDSAIDAWLQYTSRAYFG